MAEWKVVIFAVTCPEEEVEAVKAALVETAGKVGMFSHFVVNQALFGTIGDLINRHPKMGRRGDAE